MKSILLIEDDPFLADIYNTKLKKAGFSVDIAVDGQEGLRKIKEQIPDLVLLDIVLPNVDGWEFLNRVRKDYRLSDLKIVIISNLAQKGEIKKGLELGAIKYLIKAHYTPSEIVDVIKKILK